MSRTTERGSDLGIEVAHVAAEHEDRVALLDSEQWLTFGQLLHDARGLAALIPPPRDERPRPVALLMPHAARTAVAMVACLLAGRPYCVLNPAQPRSRLEDLLTTVGPELIWAADAARGEELEEIGLPAEVPVPARVRARGAQGPPQAKGVAADRLCAVYVTSGSSGRPKTVGYRHVATLHRAGHYRGTLGAGPADRFALTSPPWTAAFASALFAALLSGASVRLVDAAGSGTAVAPDEATVWHSAPSAFRRLAGSGALDGNRFRFLRFIGEPLLSSDVELARRVCGADTGLITTYGLTETNGVATQQVVPLGEAGPDAHLHSGRAIDGVDVWIEDDAGARLPHGMEGEILVGGELLSAGYLGSSERDETGTRYVRRGDGAVVHTGDRGVLSEDGSLKVRGRRDRRLNIAGNRIDPTEVEAAALTHDAVLDAAVVPFDTPRGGLAMALFVTPNGTDDRVSRKALQNHIEERVPVEALPAKVRILERIPHTAAGKVDRLRLARLASADRVSTLQRGRVDPLTTHLARLWEEALEIDAVEPDEDFFALGGDSLAAAEVCAGIENVYGVSLEPAALLDHRSPSALAERLRSVLAGGGPEAPAVLSLNPSGTEAPIFVVPGAGSDATALVHFADAIGSAQPVNVVQLPGADGRSAPPIRMEQLAEHCVDALLESGVGPPYRLAGTSFGGLVAYELARRLRREGAEIAYLGLFDTPAPATRRGHYTTRPMRRLVAGTSAPANVAIRDPRRTLKRLGKRLTATTDAYAVTFSVLRRRHGHPAELRFRYLRAGCEIAGDRWRPQPSSVPVHLYRCELQPPHLAGSPLLGWEELAPDVTVRELPSRHGRHIRPPAVSHLAALVREDLGAATAALMPAEPAPDRSR